MVLAVPAAVMKVCVRLGARAAGPNGVGTDIVRHETLSLLFALRQRARGRDGQIGTLYDLILPDGDRLRRKRRSRQRIATVARRRSYWWP